MNGSLSQGLSPLEVEGNRIVDAVTREPVMLRGVNRSGLEYSGPLGKAGVTVEEVRSIVKGWQANVIRLPLNQTWALAQPGYDPEPYLSTLDFVIGAAAAEGAYTLLDLQWLDAGTVRGTNSNGSKNFVPPLPNLLSLALWQQLSIRYSHESAVLYDVFNEPHDKLPDDLVPLLGIGDQGVTFPLEGPKVSMAEWQPWARHLIAAVRSGNPRALIFVSGVNWGYDLRGFPIPGIEGVVYSSHVYRNKGKHWSRAFGNLSSRAPVFAGEWGGGAEDVEWGRELATYFIERNIGSTAWSWSDFPRLVDALTLQPTAFGRVVQDYLASTHIFSASDRRT